MTVEIDQWSDGTVYCRLMGWSFESMLQPLGSHNCVFYYNIFIRSRTITILSPCCTIHLFYFLLNVERRRQWNNMAKKEEGEDDRSSYYYYSVQFKNIFKLTWSATLCGKLSTPWGRLYSKRHSGHRRKREYDIKPSAQAWQMVWPHSGSSTGCL